MKRWRKQFAFMLLLLLPLQAMAASLSALTCYADHVHQSDMQDPDRGMPHQHDDGASHQHDSGAGTDHSGHLNCHHVFSGMPATMHVATPPELQAFAPSVSLLYTLFVPELPQRPPRG